MATGTKITGLQEVTTLEATRKIPVADIGINESITYANLLTQLSTDLGSLDILTTKGDIISHDGSNPIRFGVGSDGQYLTSSSGDLIWSNFPDALVDPTISNGDMIVRTGGDIDRLGVGSEGQLLTVSGGEPSWETLSQYVDPLSSNGDLLTRNGGVTQKLGIGSNGQVLTVSGGLPSWSSLSLYNDPLTTRGDVVVRGNSSTNRLALGSSGQVLTSNGTDAVWSDAGHYIDPLTTNGDILRRSGGSTSRLGVGTNGQYLTVSGGLPTWTDLVLVGSVENDGNTASYTKIKTRVIEIGAWNMDTTRVKSVSHGLGSDFSKVRDISVTIINDAGTSLYNLIGVNNPQAVSIGISAGSINELDSSTLSLGSSDGLFFDGSNFAGVSSNRGWITFTYEDT